jgi:sec-independent protein translocase protein TatC
MTDIGNYLDFVLTLFIAFGLAFEVPIAVVMAVRFGWVNRKNLQEARGYVIVGAFVIGAIFTPPDIISQFMLAVPMWLLYELGIVVSKFVERTEPTILPPV